MTGDDFFNLAHELSQDSAPAKLRSAISRAYYGAFHVARGLLDELGITLPETAASHDKVQHLLNNSGDRQLEKVAGKLGDLRTARNDADYDLDRSHSEKRANVVRELRSADEIMQSLRECFSGHSGEQVREPIRTYAQDILRLRVRH